ncbi:hypothetical protein EX30DRAFT_361919 [Ascodesmis nigricans]|uniref:Uncharacterized protein n=1 Tax=Ascodesmis nigricans TaxID=341454 RepID=A0A4V3SJH1_9PEZI|nr:hypothetical protein EX30DRAFT_361919 [Ascodesmis nigricans]
MTNFTSNLLLFSPLLVLAAAILYLLDRGPTLRAGAGLTPSPVEEETILAPEEDYEGEEPAEDVASDLEPEPEPDIAEEAGEEDNNIPEVPTAGPAAQPTRQVRTRTVGTKKAASLARRDARRAYNEFMRSQAQQRAEAEKELIEQERTAAFENARRRAVVEEEIAARKEEEKRRRREKEEREAKELRELVLGKVARGRFKLEDPRWEKVLRKEGLVGVLNDGEAVGLVTKEGEWVRVNREHLEALWMEVEIRGGMKWREMSEWLEVRIEGKGKGIARE